MKPTLRGSNEAFLSMVPYGNGRATMSVFAVGIMLVVSLKALVAILRSSVSGGGEPSTLWNFWTAE